jgi:hypothetical protein
VSVTPQGPGDAVPGGEETVGRRAAFGRCHGGD